MLALPDVMLLTIVCRSVHQYQQSIVLILVPVEESLNHAPLINLHLSILSFLQQVSPDALRLLSQLPSQTIRIDMLGDHPVRLLGSNRNRRTDIVRR